MTEQFWQLVDSRVLLVAPPFSLSPEEDEVVVENLENDALASFLVLFEAEAEDSVKTLL